MKASTQKSQKNNLKKAIFSFVLLAVTTLTFAQQPSAFEVKVIGKGQPVLLIPGYSCSGEVWNETVDHLKNNYELHVLTLAGFGGVKPIEDEEILRTVKNQIIQYVKDKKLNKPALIGHSLGAFMTLWVQSTEPELFGKGICVDGLPFLSAIGKPETTAASLKSNPQYNKEMVIANFKALPNEGYVANMTKSMLYQVTDSIRAKQIAEWSYKSDRKTLGSTIVEMATTDLRKDIATIKSPILVMASIFGTKEASEKIYNEQYVLLKNKTIKVADSKHFIMYDQPQWFYNEIDTFLKTK